MGKMNKIGTCAGLMLVICLGMSGCGNGSQGAASSAGDDTAKRGSFSGHLGQQAYEVAVTCQDLDKDYFRFLSDRTDATDDNDDGLIISGMQNGKKFVFTLVDHGNTYSTGNLQSFKKNASGMKGSGSLWPDGGGDTAQVDFTVHCP